MPGKNIHLLPKIAKIVSMILKREVCLLIIGDGVDSRIVKSWDDICVKWFRYIPHNELVNYYNIMDLFVLPSSSEGLSMVTIEAMASGIPVISSKAGGVLEVVPKEWIFDLENLYASLHKVDWYNILSMPRENIRNMVREKFDMQKLYSQEYEILSTLI